MTTTMHGSVSRPMLRAEAIHAASLRLDDVRTRIIAVAEALIAQDSVSAAATALQAYRTCAAYFGVVRAKHGVIADETHDAWIDTMRAKTRAAAESVIALEVRLGVLPAEYASAVDAFGAALMLND
jgi:hypothetical protein